MLAGAAYIDITPPLGTAIQGASVANCAERVRDPLEANALYLEQGETRLLLINVDVVGLDSAVVAEFRRRLASTTGLAEDAIIIAATHTHTGPVVLWTNYRKPVNAAFRDQLGGQLEQVAAVAMAQARPAALRGGRGVTRIGYNRRCCWADGTHTMHGNPALPTFTGLEGVDDPEHTALFLEAEGGQLLAILHHNTSHPTSFYGCSFFSADFPGAARGYLREVCGPIAVLYLNGAFGDISLGNQHGSGPRSGEAAMLRAAHLMAGETLRLYHDSTVAIADPELAHLMTTVELPIRLPEAAHLEWARQLLEREDAGETIDSWQLLRAHGAVYLRDDFGEQATDTLRLHAWRLGEFAFLSQPLELFCQFGLDIKRRSPFAITSVVGIADGYHGYCPTVYGALGGGYSGEPIWWTRFTADAGYRLVDKAADLLRQLKAAAPDRN